MTGDRIPQDLVEKAGALDVAALAERYGFAKAHGRGETVGPCPGCGGDDRFSVNAAKNIWRCRQGGGEPVGGDAIALVQHVEQCSFRRAIEILLGDLDGLVPRADPKKARKDAADFREEERARAFDLWRAARPFPDGGAVAGYLRARALDPALARMPGAHCREHGDLPFWHHVRVGGEDRFGKPMKAWRVIHRGPAMVWPIQAADGRFLGLHATWIDLAAAKAKAEIFDPDTGEQLPAKKVRGSQKGGRIVLRDVLARSPHAAAGEGVESCLSWHAERGLDVSLDCAVNLNNLAGRAARTFAHPMKRIARRDGRHMPVRVPGPEPREDDDPALLYAPHAGVEQLTLIGDGDSDPIVTHAAMQRAEARLARPGTAIAVDWPPAGHDFNSHRMERIGHGLDG